MDMTNGRMETLKTRQEAIDAAKSNIDNDPSMNRKRGAHIGQGLDSGGHMESTDCFCIPEVIPYKDSYLVVHRRPS